jgi:hypothetical protein
MRQSTSGFEAQESGLPNWAFWLHGTGDGRKGLIAHSGAKLAVGDATCDGEAMETTRMRPGQREMDRKQRRCDENRGDMAPSWILTVN